MKIDFSLNFLFKFFSSISTVFSLFLILTSYMLIKKMLKYKRMYKKKEIEFIFQSLFDKNRELPFLSKQEEEKNIL